MAVCAKFKVQRIEQIQTVVQDGKTADGTQKHKIVELRTIVLLPVYGGGDPNHENTKYWQASPSGEIKLGTVMPAAWEQFKLGGEYYIDFTLVDNDLDYAGPQ